MERLKRWAANFKRIFRRRSLQYVISSTFTLLVVFGILLVSIVYSFQLNNFANATLSQNNERVVEQVNLNLDNYLRNMMRLSNAMYYSVIKDIDIGRETMSDEMYLLYQANSDLLVSLAVFREDGEVLDAQPLFQLKQSARPQEEEWFQSAMDRVENLYFSTPHVQNLFQNQGSYRWVVSLSRNVQMTENGVAKGGVLLVDMNFSGIEQICRNVDLSDTGYIYLISNDGELIYHPRQQLIYSGLAQENNLQAAQLDDGSHTDTLDGMERMVTVKTVGYTGWKIVGVTPMRDVIQSNYQTTRLIWLIAFVAISLLVFLNLFLSSRITDPIRGLEAAVKEIELGDMDVAMPAGGSYEVQHLAKTIDQMRGQVKKLLKDVIAEQEGKRKSEMDALQAQINPHFLYNTLDSIIWMIENQEYGGAIKMVTALSALFRISLSKGHNIISVAEELAHVEHYMIIQQMRYRNTFSYEIEAEKEALECATIKLVVQPLVENSIYHSMKYMGGEGMIRIKAYIEDGDLFIAVIDNGLGMSQEKADTLLVSEYPQSSGNGVGLKNVDGRIKVYFGEQYGLEIASEPDVGTVVRIHLPALPVDEVRRKGAGES